MVKAKIFFTFLLFILPFFVIAQTTNITDTNFEQHLIDLGIDSNGLNGNILNSDAEAQTSLVITSTIITNFTGLEAFVNLTTLNLGRNQFATIPLNTLTVLENLYIDDNDALNSLNLSQNIALKILEVETNIFVAGEAPITTLDLSANVNLEAIKIRNLRNLSNLTLPFSSTLKKIEIVTLSVATLDFSNLDGLEDLNITGSNVPVNIILPNETSVLSKIYFSSITLITVDVSNYIALTRLSLYSTNVENLLLPSTTTFEYLTIWGHNFVNPISLAMVSNLIFLDIRNNNTTPLVIDLTSNPLLETIWLTNNDLVSIDFSNNTLLETLYIYDNNLTSLDFTQNTIIKRINASRNQLATIDLTQNTQLKYLTVSSNLFTDIDVTNNILLQSFSIGNNLLTNTGIDLTQNVVLHYFDASENQIQSLDISHNVELVSLVLHHNLFTGTAILDQLFTIKSGYHGVSASNIIDVSFNQLSGSIPNFASLVGTNANYFRFRFNDNNFHFGDFESHHNQYVLFLTQTNTFGTLQLPIMTDYRYAPQAKVNTIDNINANVGTTVVLTTTVRGSQNHYKWFKDGVEIVGAPDAPQYTITSVSSCDAAVYYSEIRSDLVPFENSNPPGTNNRNLLLVRNDITLTVDNISETCVSLNSPANNDIDVPINSGISWTDNPSSCGYFISVGTTSGGTDIINNLDVADVTSYNFPTNLPSNTQIFVTITPYFQSGVVLSCMEETFTTGSNIAIPSCATFTNPTNGSTNVLINETFTWNAIASATGYFISIGTTSGGTEIANNIDVGNVSSYTHTTNFLENTTYYATVIAYNTAGNAIGCSEISFTTETTLTVPVCTLITNPSFGAINVPINETFTWNAIASATGYFISIGTSSGGTEIANNIDLGNVTTYTHSNNFLENTTYFITVTPYNVTGNAINCGESNFTTKKNVALHIPTFFSPNGDGRNDNWKIVDENLLIKNIRIYNRFGKLIFVINDANIGWNGLLFPPSDYWYNIELIDGNFLRGHFSLIQ